MTEREIPHIGEPNLADGLKALGSSSTTYDYGMTHEPDPDVLERFPNPTFERAKLKKGSQGTLTSIDIIVPEFTSLCPKTHQPDFAKIVIKYFPDQWCVESKSLKLYMMQFRMFGSFHEACVDRIGNDLVMMLEPIALQVQGQFAARGGIPFWPTFSYQRPQDHSGSPILRL